MSRLCNWEGDGLGTGLCEAVGFGEEDDGENNGDCGLAEGVGVSVGEGDGDGGGRVPTYKSKLFIDGLPPSFSG